MSLRIFDTHCDVIYKMLMDSSLDFGQDSPQLDITLEKLKQGHVKAQCFAVYLPEERCEIGFSQVLKSIDLFYERILPHPEIRFVRSAEDLRRTAEAGKIGAILTLEGVDALHGSIASLRTLHHLGVRVVGLTWNYGNWAADGVLEPRQAGLTRKGRMFVEECDRLGIIVDVSHLAERSFWDLLETTKRPVIATHSNAHRIHAHPRNLTDEQISAVVERGGVIGLTFVPYFVGPEGKRTIGDLLKHLDHICALGGSRNVGFGSDFDGIEEWIPGLEHAGRYGALVDELLRHYKEADVRRFLYDNWHDFYLRELPAR